MGRRRELDRGVRDKGWPGACCSSVGSRAKWSLPQYQKLESASWGPEFSDLGRKYRWRAGSGPLLRKTGVHLLRTLWKHLKPVLMTRRESPFASSKKTAAPPTL